MNAPIDDNTKSTVQKIPLLVTRAGPRDGEDWTKRLKEEYLALIQVCAIVQAQLLHDKCGDARNVQALAHTHARLLHALCALLVCITSMSR